MRIPDIRALPADLSAHRGHVHFWDHAMSRRQFLKSTGAASGVVLSSGLWMPLVAHAGVQAEPRPIPGTTNLQVPNGPNLGERHFFFPTTNPFSTVTVKNGNGDPSTITDFNGVVGVADLDGTGKDGDGTELLWGADVRFMKGVFVGEDGEEHYGTFSEI